MDSSRIKPLYSFNRLHNKDILYAFIVVLCNLAILWILLGNMLFRLNYVSFAKDGDGVKSYFSSIYHVKYDQGYSHTDAMNYPFGEHIFFTDSQPLLINTVKWISNNIADISGSVPGIINSLMLLAIVFGALLIYLILRKLGLPVIISILSATSIVWLSPQIARMGGHFALSYLTHIPAVILLLVFYAEKPSLLRSLAVTIGGIVLALTHFYFLGIYAVLLIIFWMSAFWKIPNQTLTLTTKFLHLFVQLILPFLLIQLYLGVTDSIADRPGTPWGFMHYRAYPESVLLPLGMPHGHWLTSRLNFNTGYIDWEGHAYAGLISSIFFIGLFFWLLYSLATLKFSRFLNPFNNSFISMLFWAGTLALLYSFAVPFVFNLEWMLKYLGPIRQMRGVARFAWLFFYVMQIVILFLAWRRLQGKGNLMRYTIMGIIILVTATEAYFNARSLRSSLDNPLRITETKINVHNPEKYQAIVPLPYFHVGSENISWEDKGGLLPIVFQASLNSGIPTTAVMLSRTSITQTFMQIEPFLKGTGEPEIFSMYDNRDILFLIALNQELTPVQQDLAVSSNHLWSNEFYRLGSLSAQTYRRIIRENRALREQENEFITFSDITIPDIRKYSRVAEIKIPAGATGAEINFVVEGIKGDLIPRTTANVVVQNIQEQNLYDNWQSLAQSLIGLEGEYGIHRIVFDIPDEAYMIHFNTINRGLKKQQLTYKDIRVIFTIMDEK